MGNLGWFFGDPVRRLLALHQRYGDVAALGRGDASLVCAFAEEHTRTVLSAPTRFENFAEIPIPMPADCAPMRLSRGLTSLNGDQHRKYRRMLMPIFSKSAVELYRDATCAEIARRRDRLAPGRDVDMVREMTELSLAIALSCLFGIETSSERDSFGRLGVTFLECMIAPLAMLIPIDVAGMPYRRLMRVGSEMEARIRQLIVQRRSGAAGNDVLSLMVRAEDEAGLGLSDAGLVGHVSVMFVAGFETTANTLAWTLFLLSQHPEQARALGEELESVLGGRAPDVGDLPKLKVLDAVVKESMRLLPAAPLLFMRRATEPFALGTWELPAQSIVFLSPLVAHRDPDVFADPMAFRPERWETIAPGPYQYLPFGAGARLCLGAAFAAQTVRLVLATLLQRVHATLAPDAVVSRKVRGIVLGLTHGLPMRLQDPRRPMPRPTRLPRGDIHELVRLPSAG